MTTKIKHYSLLIWVIPFFIPVSAAAAQKISLAKQIEGQNGPVFSTKRNWILRNITFKGKLKTKKKYAMEIMGLKKGMILTNVSICELRTNLVFQAKKDRYFYDVETTFIPNPPHLDVVLKVKEKWSFFPIPVLSYSDSRWSYGLGFLEGNFLGSKNQIGGMFLYKDGYPSFNVAFNFHKLFVDNMGALITAFSAKKKKYSYDNNYNETGSFKETGTGYLVNFRYNHNGIKFWLRHTLVHHEFDNTTEDGWESFLDASVILRKWTSLEDYETGYWFRFTLGRDVSWMGSDYGRTVFNWSFSFALRAFKDHNLLIDHSGIISNGIPDELRYEVGNGTSGWNPSILGYRSGQYAARHFVFNRIEYRIPIASFKLFNFSVVGFTEHMTFTSEKKISNLKHIYNVGISFRVYLRRLLLPALVLYGVYAEDNRNFDFGASIGAKI